MTYAGRITLDMCSYNSGPITESSVKLWDGFSFGLDRNPNSFDVCCQAASSTGQMMIVKAFSSDIIHSPKLKILQFMMFWRLVLSLSLSLSSSRI
jgi:hypothetical protein